MNRIADIIALHDAYSSGREAYVIGMQKSAASYASAFETAWERRQQQRAEDRRQWLTVILPAIKNEASLRRYERGMDRNSGAVPEAR